MRPTPFLFLVPALALVGCATCRRGEPTDAPGAPADFRLLIGKGGGFTGQWRGITVHADGGAWTWSGLGMPQDSTRAGTPEPGRTGLRLGRCRLHRPSRPGDRGLGQSVGPHRSIGGAKDPHPHLGLGIPLRRSGFPGRTILSAHRTIFARSPRQHPRTLTAPGAPTYLCYHEKSAPSHNGPASDRADGLLAG